MLKPSALILFAVGLVVTIGLGGAGWSNHTETLDRSRGERLERIREDYRNQDERRGFFQNPDDRYAYAYVLESPALEECIQLSETLDTQPVVLAEQKAWLAKVLGYAEQFHRTLKVQPPRASDGYTEVPETNLGFVRRLEEMTAQLKESIVSHSSAVSIRDDFGLDERLDTLGASLFELC